MPIKFQVYKDKAEEFRFHLLDEKSKIIAVSEAYAQHESCLKGIKSVQNNCNSEIEDSTIRGEAGKNPKYLIFNDEESKFRFHLTASNGLIIFAASKGFETKEQCMNGIEVVKKSCNAEIEDLTVLPENVGKPNEEQSSGSAAAAEKRDAANEKGTETQEKLPFPDDRLVWSKALTAGQIRKLENEISVAFKHCVNEKDPIAANAVEAELISANDCFAKDQNLVDAQDHLINAKHKLNTLINKLSPQDRWQYIISIWGGYPNVDCCHRIDVFIYYPLLPW